MAISGAKALVNSPTLLKPAITFAEELWSALPYIEVKSRELYDYSAVIMDEEHILGIQVCHAIHSIDRSLMNNLTARPR